MALLARVAAACALLAGCYSPEVRDCTVTCASSADCAGAQVCNGDHFCAAQGTTCSSVAASHDAALGDTPDASDAPVDAHRQPPADARPPVDAHPPIDARPIDAPPPQVTLHLHVDGHGTLDFGTFSCAMDCNYQVTPGLSITILAVPGNNQRLDRWTQGPCVNSQLSACTFTPTMNLTVAAKFHKGDD
jgi:hypothetical protein